MRGALSALERELLKRLSHQYEDCSLIIRHTDSDGLSVFCGNKDDKKIENILQEIRESADDWFY
ncbi:DinI-like family protein [Citrobacter amalonaticus]|uniref:DinI-like family protein n=1 Tax=Citrobacter amalonaticus TaxID=35703 RepID=UPI001F39093E|nr:DinI-like family protein [Citrobacter amalonaticus]